MFFSQLAIFSLLSLADASPLATRRDVDLATRQTVDCSPNSQTGLKAECWASLNVDQYIQDWIAANGTAADCANLGFAQCYLQFNGLTTLTCNLITSSTCPPPSATDTYFSEQHFYTLWNIYAIYQFFNQYSAALSAGASLAGQTVDAIVAAVAPPVEAQSEMSSLLSVLTSTIGFVTTFSGIIPGGGGTAAGFIASGITRALSLSSDVPSALLQQTANDRFIQLGQIGSQLANLVKSYQNNLLNATSLIQGDDALFRAACADGGFSQRVTTSLTIQANELYSTLQLFILSSALNANGLVSAKSAATSPLTMASQTDNVNCPSLTEPSNSCNQWFLDSEGNTYSFHNPQDTQNDHAALTKQIVDEGWATLDQVFQVGTCSGQTTEFDPKTLGLNCINTIKSCEWNYQPTLAETKANPQFKDCDNDPNWGSLCSSFEERIVVPKSYLGPILLDDSNGFAQMCFSQ